MKLAFEQLDYIVELDEADSFIDMMESKGYKLKDAFYTEAENGTEKYVEFTREY